TSSVRSCSLKLAIVLSFDLEWSVPRRLADIGMPEDGIARAAEMAVRSPYANPRPVERVAIQDLIAAAWRGDAPARH
ncbi:MAG: hypothetical protein ACK463_05835, partial [Bradyrhizobium sp.]